MKRGRAIHRVATLLAAAALILMGSGPAAQPRTERPESGSSARVALVIGNGAYEVGTALANPVADAEAIAATLDRLGFEATLATDLGRRAMAEAIQNFAERAAGAEMALFYYAGHGLQVGGRNHLVPVDARLERESALDFETFDLDLVLRQMQRAAGPRVLMLDACRDNPFRGLLSRAMGAARSSAVGRGLARIDTEAGALIAFATQPDNVALDGAGRHSPFAAALLDHLETPGVEINTMLTRVRGEVIESTGGRQVPWTNSSLLREVYLAAPAAPLAPPPAQPPAPAFDPALLELELWRAAEASGSAAAYAAYLARFPDGIFAEMTRLRLSALRPAAEEPPSSPQGVADHAALAPLEPDPTPAPDARPADSAPSMPNFAADFPEMVAIPAGVFTMGAPRGEGEPAEQPERRVEVAAFKMARTETTVAQFLAFVEATGRRDLVEGRCYRWVDGALKLRDALGLTMPPRATQRPEPMRCVSRAGAQAYLDWLNRVTMSAAGSLRYALPSEAQFEYALRAGGSTRYPWPDEDHAGFCAAANGADAGSAFRWRNRACDDGHPGIAPVASFPANAFGLHDLSGNVWEWTADCWNDNHAGAPSDDRARSDGVCASGVVRGGSFDDPPENLRSAYRAGIPANRRQENVGFRIVLIPERRA